MLKPVKLFGEQKRVLFLPHKSPIQIKGVAGSGKTTVALYRAKHLLDTHSDLFTEPRVAIFTFNKTLVQYIEALKSSVGGGIQEDSDEINPVSPAGIDVTVTNFHKWAWHYLNRYGVWQSWSVAGRAEQEDGLTSSIATVRQAYGSERILTKYDQFYKEEFSWIKGQMFQEKDQYMKAARTGRGTQDRVTSDDKELLWECFSAYRNMMREKNLVDFDDFALFVHERIERDSSFEPPYSHLVVDEAQDLSKAQMMVLRKLVDPSTDSITVIADAAQRIYKSGFTWSEVGINVRGGRTIEFKKNYRNTKAIALAAGSLLDHEEDKTEFTQIEPARKGGHKPVIGYFDSWGEQINYVADLIDDAWIDESDTVLLHRTNRGVDAIDDALGSRGFPVVKVRGRRDPFDQRALKVCTLSSVKGLEFDNVIILDLNEDEIPYPPGFNDEDDAYHISTERRLLYTAMTRAREKLYLLSSGQPTRYLAEIHSELVDTVHGFSNSTAPLPAYAPDDDLPF